MSNLYGDGDYVQDVIIASRISTINRRIKMLIEDEGVKAIIFLQKLVGVDEPEEVARKNWRAMPKQDKEQTEKVYEAFRPLVEEGSKSCTTN